ncbi:MAG: queuosine precursor transporter [Bacteroidota bacterium]|nr:queuosine precursor transporter [Bacteroidota bacterium]
MKNQVSIMYLTCSTLFAVCLIIANIVESKIVNVFGINTTAGLVIFPITYILNDVISEVWGFRKARLIIWMGFFMNFLAVAVFKLAIAMPASPYFEHQGAFSQVLGSTQRITTASFIAFLCGSFVNAYVMSKMKKATQGRGFSIRAVVSTLFGEGLDSVIFFSIAFYGSLPGIVILTLIGSQTAMKTIYEIIALPLTNFVVKWVKRTEQTDAYDLNISYNPLKIRDL